MDHDSRLVLLQRPVVITVMNTDDKQLISLLKAGDEQAMAELFEAGRGRGGWLFSGRPGFLDLLFTLAAAAQDEINNQDSRLAISMSW